MASLRSNLLISGASMVLVGLVRPGFNGVVNWVFGSAVNGQANALIALIFLASLPATAGLPTVAVKHYSQAAAAGHFGRASAYVRMSVISAVTLSALGIALGSLHGLLNKSHPPGPTEIAFLALAVMSYSLWTLLKGLLLAMGEASRSLRAEILSVSLFLVALTVVSWLHLEAYVVFAFVLPYVCFVLMNGKALISTRSAEKLAPDELRSFLRHSIYWFIASASSLSARELTLLFLDHRTSQAAVGEVSVALSVVMLLAFAPRILTMPLVHELASVSGERAITWQRSLTERAIHWLVLLSLASGIALCLLAKPLLAIVGNVHGAEVVVAFVLITLAFMCEMMITPVVMLVAVRAHPAVLAVTGASSLVLAFTWWFGPWASTMTGVVVGLAVSHLSKAVLIGGYARLAFGVRLIAQPGRYMMAGAGAVFLLVTVHRFGWNAWLCALGFELMILALFARELSGMLSAVTGRGVPAAVGQGETAHVTKTGGCADDPND